KSSAKGSSLCMEGSHDSLPTVKNKWKRKLETINWCKICGMEEEYNFHVVMSCTKAKTLRSEMRTIWELPPEEQLTYTGPDWLLVLLNSISKDMKTRMLLVMWRS